MTERAAVGALLDNRLTPERERALELALELGPRAAPDLRAAVIHAAWAEIRGETARPDGSEAAFAYMEAVARLRDPQAIPFLVRVIGSGTAPANALADLGGRAFPAVLAVAMDPAAYFASARNSLTSLRFMLLDGSLSSAQAAQLRQAVRDRLAEPQDHTVLRAALDIASLYGETDLHKRVSDLARDRDAVAALVSPHLGSGDMVPDAVYRRWVDGVHKHARDLLAGAELLPARRPYPR